ncbi:TPA: inverse autotransporter beta domain-containing protein, partial [Enterobacter cloacae]
MNKIFFYHKNLKRVSVLNICLQLSLSLAPFAPFSMAHAQERIATKPYVLESGETAITVSSKLGITVSELQKINQFRTFSKGFSSIGEGSEIDIPVSNAKANSLALPSEDNDPETVAANFVTQAGSFLNTSPDANDAANLARGVATDRAAQEIQSWLDKKGTAKVALSTDENFSLKGSSIDVLYPLSENRNMVFFTQNGIRDADDRIQANLGLGLRYFDADYMVGANIFYDHDISRNHNRLGLGAEYWRDYFKLGANAYVGLSGWKDSPDIEDYEERSADGWDIRTEGYLPAYPQLGGKLQFEQYFGDKVGLFGHSEDDLQKNPYAITAGIIYTPLPLVSVNADYKSGKNGKDETQLGLNINYSLGVPFKDQINPDNVVFQKTLLGSRYDLVDRNNNIVLEYRKKEVIKLRTVSLITGSSGDQRSLEVAVKATHGLKEIKWNAGAFLKNGGKIIHDGGESYSIVLPAYSVTGENNYLITGVAYDKKGNASSPAETQVSVIKGKISQITSRFTPAQSSLTADGASEQILRLSLRDEKSNPVPVRIEDINLGVERSQESADVKRINSSKLESVLSAFREVSAGDYDVTVKAGTINEVITLIPVVEGITLPSAKVTVGGSPVVSELKISGTLEVGKVLNGTYVFNANGGEPTDKSLYQWGHKGETAGNVGGSGAEVASGGTVPAYTL